jgi:hypothetical protein
MVYDWIFPDASLELGPWTKPKLPARQVIGAFAD